MKKNERRDVNLILPYSHGLVLVLVHRSPGLIEAQQRRFPDSDFQIPLQGDVNFRASEHRVSGESPVRLLNFAALDRIDNCAIVLYQLLRFMILEAGFNGD